MRKWANENAKCAFWLTGFTYPAAGFLTALLQTTARKDGVSIDNIAFEFPVLNQDPRKTLRNHRKMVRTHTAYILKEQRWDHEAGTFG